MRERERAGGDAASLEGAPFDVAIVGAGINGACLYHLLCEAGLRVLLVDRGDFASGTSQASSMMVWGGLLYLRNLDFRTVVKLCRSRDRMVAEMGESVRASTYRFVSTGDDARRPWLLSLALWLYWSLALLRTRAPGSRRDFPELALLERSRVAAGLEYGEASVRPSDARFVLRWILSHRSADHVALSYCRLDDAFWNPRRGLWDIALSDVLGGGAPRHARARCVVNCAGAWTDALNRRCGRDSPYRHVLSKGVHVALRREPLLETQLLFETRRDADVMTLIPWGPVALWGPTETVVTDLERGFRAERSDVDLLLGELNRHLARPAVPSDVVSLRCGVRTLAVERDRPDGPGSLQLSRRTLVHRDVDAPWVSVYGGKLTGCPLIARQVASALEPILGRDLSRVPAHTPPALAPENEAFPGLEEAVPSPRWCAANEACRTLEDWLRRRTNIAQWVARGGLGARDENVPHLLEAARAIHGSALEGEAAVSAYRAKVRREHDAVLEEAPACLLHERAQAG